jgi:chromosome segregation ATPase
VQLSRRLQAVESAVQDCLNRVASVTTVLQHLDEIQPLRNQVAECAAAIDSVTRQSVPELRRQIDETRRSSAVFDKNIQLVSQALQGLQQDQAGFKQGVDDLSRDLAALGRQTQVQLQAIHDDHVEKDRDRVVLHQRSQETLRELQLRSERIEKDFGGRFRDALEELNTRTNENFRQVEVSARSVDAELQKIRTDIGNIRAEFNSMDNNVRNRFGKVTEDVDAKFEMVLSLLNNVEKNSSVLEDALASAGRALATRREMQSAFGPGGGVLGSGGQQPLQTTTTTSLRGNVLTSDVRRNFTGELSGNRGPSTGSAW